jgi:tetrahydromethanopterin S-methyltransferase subunit F
MTSWSGDAILLTNTTVPTPDPVVEQLLLSRYNETQVFRRQVIGRSRKFLNGTRDCRFQQCGVGVLAAEVMRIKGNAYVTVFC